MEGNHFRFRELKRGEPEAEKGKVESFLPSRCETDFLLDPGSPRLPYGVCGGPLQLGIRYVARPRVALRPSQVFGPVPNFEPMKLRQVRRAWRNRSRMDVHMFDDGSEYFIDGEDFVRILHSSIFR